MKRIFLLTALLAALSHPAFAQEDISININGDKLYPEQPPVVMNNRTLVPVRVVCEAMGLDVEWDGVNERVNISNDDTYVSISINCHDIDINGSIKYIDAAPVIVNSTTCVPIRAVVEPFGANVDWDSETQTVIITVSEDEPETPADEPDTVELSATESITDEISEDNEQTVSKSETEDEALQKSEVDDTLDDDAPEIVESGFAFYAQPDEEWGFKSNGRGYCWVCSYAMLISNISGERITPVDVAQYNLDAGSSSGSYMAGHFGIAANYNLKFVPAIDEDSEYFERFDSSHRGATYFKAETDEDVENALIEALKRNPDGIMVRFEGYPHTLVATEYKDGEIYYNDPASLNMENVTFDNTVVGKRFNLSDLTFVQAMVRK